MICPPTGCTQKNGFFDPFAWMETKADDDGFSVGLSKNVANPAIVGAWNRADKGKSQLRRFLIMVLRRNVSREWPPSSKKLSFTPTRSSRSTSHQIFASASSSAVRGAK